MLPLLSHITFIYVCVLKELNAFVTEDTYFYVWKPKLPFFKIYLHSVTFLLFLKNPRHEMMGGFFVLRFYLFIFRERAREGERSMCSGFSCTPNQGLDLQPRHVPWLGIEPVILLFTGQHSIQWATPSRTFFFYFRF